VTFRAPSTGDEVGGGHRRLDIEVGVVATVKLTPNKFECDRDRDREAKDLRDYITCGMPRLKL
jgi:hypothetical protein